MSSWDRVPYPQLLKLQDRLVREQVEHAVGPFSPYWKKRLADLGRAASSVDTVAALATLAPVGERDVSPSGDPAGMAALVLQATEGGFALHAKGPDLRRAMRLRLTRPDAYRRVVDNETKPTSYVWSGLGFRYPLASTRADLDVVARTGARLWRVLGLSGNDALLSAVPLATTTEHVGLTYAALAAGAPALFTGPQVDEVVAASRLAPPTVLAVSSADAAATVTAVAEAGGSLERLSTLLLVGAPTPEEREGSRQALAAAGLGAQVLAVHAPAGARVLWAECRESGGATGLHTYPDHDVVQLVDPETGDPATDAGEVVLTQLGLHGSAMLRWRTGDVVPGPLEIAPCPSCGRTVPRLAGVARSALVLGGDRGRALDLRSVAGALSGRADVDDWRVVIGGRRRDGRGQVVVHLATSADPGEVAVGAAADVRAVAGLLPTQLVATSLEELERLPGEPLTRRILLRR